MNDENKIAIISMEGKYSKSNSINELWDAICSGEELNYTYEKRDESENFVSRYSKVDDALYFDYRFFGMTKREAEVMDPQHRIFLETCYQTLLNAGYGDLSNTKNIGVFASCSVSTYLYHNVLGYEEIDDYLKMMGNDKDFIASRVAYKLNLNGPALAFQCACSSSLAALHYAALSIKNDDCEAALVGGVSINFPMEQGYEYQQGGIKSQDGYCRPFNAEASGIIKGDGCSVILMKRLDKAKRDGDKILGVISATGINNDARDKIGYTAPSISGHERVIERCLKIANISKNDIDYIETHGTGTELGDRIEKEVLTQVFKSRNDKIAIGSIKGNIGHLDAAAGITSVVKVLMMLNKEIIPPTANVVKSCIEEDSKLELVLEPKKKKIRYAGISSLGIGGTNVHVILEKYSPNDETASLDSQRANFNKEKCQLVMKTRRICELNKANYVLSKSEKNESIDDVLEKVIDIWKNETGEDDIDKNTICMDTDSMELVFIIEKINSEFNKKVILSEIVECRTILDLSKYIYEINTNKVKIIHNLNKNESSEYEYYLIHPAGGNVTCYTNFNEEISNSRNIYTIDLPENYSEYCDIEALANEYLRQIMNVHDKGKKIVIGGYSFGGNVAYEIAHLMKSKGIAADGLLMFDSHPPMAYTALKTDEDIDYSSAFKQIMGCVIDERKLDKLPSEQVNQYLDKWIYCHKLLKKYTKKYKLDVPCTVFRATEKEDERILKTLNILPLPTRKEWELYLKDKPQFIDCRGDHYSMMDNSEYAKELARQFMVACK